MNEVKLTGIMQEPKHRTTTSGKEVVSFSLAHRSSRAADTQWFNIVCWNELASSVINNTALIKGSLVNIEGRLTQRTYENKEGKKVSTIEIVASKVETKDYQRASQEMPSHRAHGSNAFGQDQF